MRRDYRNRNCRDIGVELLGGPKLLAIHNRHLEVEQNQAGPRTALEVVERLLSIARSRYRITFVFQQH